MIVVYQIAWTVWNENPLKINEILGDVFQNIKVEEIEKENGKFVNPWIFALHSLGL